MSQLREQMQAIYDKHGRLEPRIVLEEAKDKSHPLHNRFEWDDSVAADKYRLEQAHDLIVSIKITYRDRGNEDKQHTIRAFHAVRDAKGYTYEPAEKVALSPLARQMVLADMEREWRQLHERYKAFAEFANMVQRDLEPMPA